jgi:hypothetical protein
MGSVIGGDLLAVRMTAADSTTSAGTLKTLSVSWKLKENDFLRFIKFVPVLNQLNTTP